MQRAPAAAGFTYWKPSSGTRPPGGRIPPTLAAAAQGAELAALRACLLDTGPLVAYLDASEEDHEVVAALLLVSRHRRAERRAGEACSGTSPRLVLPPDVLSCARGRI
jgi:hypothetical protein